MRTIFSRFLFSGIFLTALSACHQKSIESPHSDRLSHQGGQSSLMEPPMNNHVARLNPIIHGSPSFLRAQNRQLHKYPMTDFLNGETKVKVHFDRGALGVFKEAEARALVTKAISNWNQLNQQKLTNIILEKGEDIDADVNVENFTNYIFTDPDDNSSEGVCEPPLHPEYQLMVIFDNDGMIFNKLFQVSPTRYSGFATSTCDRQHPENYSWGFVLINGAVLNEGEDLYFNGNENKITNLITHEIGHALGVGHLYLNSTTGGLESVLGKNNYPLMYLDNRRDYQGLHVSDIESLVSLYPHPESVSQHHLGFIKGEVIPNLAAFADDIFENNLMNLWINNKSNGHVFSTTPFYNEKRFRFVVPKGLYQLHMQDALFQMEDLSFYDTEPRNFHFADENGNLKNIDVIESEPTYAQFDFQNPKENKIIQLGSLELYSEIRATQCYLYSESSDLQLCSLAKSDLAGDVRYSLNVVDRDNLKGMRTDSVIKSRVDVIGKIELGKLAAPGTIGQVFVLARSGEAVYFLNSDNQWENLTDVHIALKRLVSRQLKSVESVLVVDNFYIKNFGAIELTLGVRIGAEVYLQKTPFHLQFK